MSDYLDKARAWLRRPHKSYEAEGGIDASLAALLADVAAARDESWRENIVGWEGKGVAWDNVSSHPYSADAVRQKIGRAFRAGQLAAFEKAARAVNALYGNPSPDACPDVRHGPSFEAAIGRAERAIRALEPDPLPEGPTHE